MLLYIVLDQRLPVEVVHRDIEKSLILGIMEVHSNDVVGASAGQKICDECTSQSYPLLVAGFGLKANGVCGLLIIVSGETRLRGERALMVVTSTGVRAETRDSVGSPREEVFIGHGSLAELLSEAIDRTIGEAIAARTAWARGGRHALECVVLLRGRLRRF
jgi:hypothetical protein